MNTGKSHKYYWVVSRNEIQDLDKTIIKYHKNYILHLTTFDSGPLIPGEEEINEGWRTDGEIMLSPLLSDKVLIPHEQYDEWYLSKRKLIFNENLDRFVNYSGFNISPKSKTSLELQTRFWEQLAKINPETFVAIGDNDIVVSKNEKLIKYIEENA